MSRAALLAFVEFLGEDVVQTHHFRGDETVIIKPERIVEAATWLRDHPELRFNMLSDMTAVDYLPRSPRFEVVYHFYSVSRKHRLRVKVQLPGEAPEIDTLCPVYPIANWLEREVWDMYGIRFREHPDPRRILLYEAFEGHPLRKDYPKDKRQPLVRRPEDEIAHVYGPGPSRPLTPIVPPHQGDQ